MRRSIFILYVVIGILILTTGLFWQLQTGHIQATSSEDKLNQQSDGFINVCSQHPALCPVSEAYWQGEPDAWRTTGKKWTYDVNTPEGINVMWEFSFPYVGENPDYLGQQDNPYKDYTNSPDSYPLVTGTAPVTYEWERWDVMGDNYVMYQYAGTSEHNSHFVGVTDCESGVFYPVIDQTTSYSFSPMSVLRNGKCADGGYIVAQLIESWGAPRSPQRVAMCDSPVVGIPKSQTPKGNAMCKLSPYVGTVFQRYAWGAGAPPVDHVVVGCEAAVYAWGWPEHETIDNTGQDYQAWFRNGELRLSKWINFSSETAVIPAPDDDAWWNPRCEQAWTQITNWLYDGVYRIGDVIYTDTMSLPASTSAIISPAGGDLNVSLDGTSLSFPAGVFTDTVQVTHTIKFQSELSPTESLVGINHAFEVTAVYSATQQPASPTQPYTITIQYTEADRGTVSADTLALYYWDGAVWQREPTSQVDPIARTVTATPGHLSIWAVLGETRRTFLPLSVR